MIAWILLALAVIAALIGFAGQRDLKKRLREATARIAEQEATRGAPEKWPVALATNGVAVPVPDVAVLADAEKRLAATLSDVKRLESAVTEAHQHLSAEREKTEVAVARANAADGKAAQARSKSAEAGYSAVLDARKEADLAREKLSDAEKRLLAVADAEKQIQELSDAARLASAAVTASEKHVALLQAETEELRESLRQAETHVSMASQGAVAERAAAEVILRDGYEARLRDARTVFESDLRTRLEAERERFEGEQRRLSLELEKARLDAANRATVASPAHESMEPPPPIRARPITAKSAEIDGGTEDRPLVIIADTDANAVKIIAKYLEAGGYRAQSAASFADALEAARATPPVALALDGANLPDGDFWEVLASLKEDPDLKEIPILLFAPAKDRERALEMGAAGCFAKPVDKSVFIATIKQAMVKRKQRARLAAVSVGSRRTTPAP